VRPLSNSDPYRAALRRRGRPEKHFGRAAEACSVSQPTLSVSIKKLEEELDVRIFERGASEVSVTPIGDEIGVRRRRRPDPIGSAGWPASYARKYEAQEQRRDPICHGTSCSPPRGPWG
jgi:hypothetical protein